MTNSDGLRDGGIGRRSGEWTPVRNHVAGSSPVPATVFYTLHLWFPPTV